MALELGRWHSSPEGHLPSAGCGISHSIREGGKYRGSRSAHVLATVRVLQVSEDASPGNDALLLQKRGYWRRCCHLTGPRPSAGGHASCSGGRSTLCIVTDHPADLGLFDSLLRQLWDVYQQWRPKRRQPVNRVHQSDCIKVVPAETPRCAQHRHVVALAPGVPASRRQARSGPEATMHSFHSANSAQRSDHPSKNSVDKVRLDARHCPCLRGPFRFHLLPRRSRRLE